MQARASSTKSVWRVAGWVVAAVGWAILLWPPLKTYVDGTLPLTSYIKILIEPENKIYKDQIFSGWAFLAVSFLLLMAIGIAIINSARFIIRPIISDQMGCPISVSIRMEFKEKSLARCRTVREQTFLARRSGYQAYRYEHKLHSPKARFVENSLNITSLLKDEIITEKLIYRNMDRGIDVIEMFKAELPVSRWVRILNDEIVRFLTERFGLFKQFVCTRITEFETLNEYDGPVADHELVVSSQGAGRFKLDVSFAAEIAPKATDIRCLLIRQSAASELHFRVSESNGIKTFKVNLDKFNAGSFLFQWENR